MENQIKNTKLVFSLLIAALVLFIIIGSQAMKHSALGIINKKLSATANINFNKGKPRMFLKYITYKAELARISTNDVIAAMSPADRQLILSAAADNFKPAIPVLLYHGIISSSENSAASPDGVNISLKNFKNQMFALKTAGYNTITTDDLYQYLRGEKELPPKSFLLTFDDGRKDSYYNGSPVLKSTGFHAVMFVITKYSLYEPRGRYYLNKNELHDMARNSQWELQAHTVNGHELYAIGGGENQKGHFYSNKLWLTGQNKLETNQEFSGRIFNDFSTVKSELEGEFDIKVRAFAFPFGDFGQNSSNFPEAKDLINRYVSYIYHLAFFQESPTTRFTANSFDATQQNNQSFFVKRLSVDPNWSGGDLIRNIAYGMNKPLPYSDNFSNNNGWVSTLWGNMELLPGSLKISSGKTSTGSAVILDGTRDWQNYSFNVTASWPKGGNIYLWARFKDDNNYIACNFGKNIVHIEQTLGGERRVIKGIDKILPYPPGNFEIGIKVNDRVVSCLFDNQIVVSTDFLNPFLDRGGIGFKTWDVVLNNSEFDIKKIYVHEIK